MKKKALLITSVLIIIVLVIGGKIYMDKKNEEAKIVEWEKLTSAQIKNTFADVEEIHFSEISSRNTLAGIMGTTVKIVTKDGNYKLGITLPSSKKDETLVSYTLLDLNSEGEVIQPKKGKTSSKVKVIYTNNSEGEL